MQNKFKLRPQGLLISDTYNSPFFPIRPVPRVDTAQFNLPIVTKRYRELYTQFKSTFLPWHYVCEMIDEQYYIFNTRPIDMTFPIDNLTAKQIKDEKEIEWDENTTRFMKDNIFDISQAIHICIIGDSNKDVYVRKLYELIAKLCLLPTINRYKLPGGLYQRVFILNMGQRFNFNQISKFIRS